MRLAALLVAILATATAAAPYPAPDSVSEPTSLFAPRELKLDVSCLHSGWKWSSDSSISEADLKDKAKQAIAKFGQELKDKQWVWTWSTFEKCYNIAKHTRVNLKFVCDGGAICGVGGTWTPEYDGLVNSCSHGGKAKEKSGPWIEVDPNKGTQSKCESL